MSRWVGERGAVFGSVIMKNRNTSTSGDVMSTSQKWKPVIGPRCQCASIVCPERASTPIPTANVAQKPSATRSSFSRPRIVNPPARITPSASASHTDIGPHQKSSGVARLRPRIRKQRTRPMFDGLKMCSPCHLIRYLESSATAAVPA